MKEILKRLKKYKKELFFSFVMLVVATLCSVALPTLMTEILDNGLLKGNLSYIYRVCIVMGVVSVLDVVLIVVAYKMSETAVQRFCGELRSEIFEKANRMDLDEFKKIGSGALLTRSIEDVDRIGDVITTLLSALSQIPVMMIAGTILAFRKDVVLALILFAFVPLLLFIVYIVMKDVDTLWQTSDEYMDKQNALIRSRLVGIRVVRAFNREDYEQEKIDKATHIMAKNIINANIRSGLIGPVSMLVLNLATVLIVFVGANRITTSASLTAGGILAVIEYIGMIMSGIMTISFSIAMLPRAKVNIQRIGEVLAAKSEPEGDMHTEIGNSVSLKNVSFKFAGSDKYALENINIEIASGEKVCFIGGTGSGKSATVRLIVGLNRPTEGELYFGSVNADMLTEREIRSGVSCVLQKTAIFSGTIKENVLAGSSDTDENVVSALKDAQLYSFVQEQKEGLDYPVTQRGGNLSGGQNQRLAISRAILKKAGIYVFDDSFSALDFMTESKLREALNKRLKGKTQIIVTQRVMTAEKCDKIYLFEHGKISAFGTHEELLKTSPVYKEIYLSQTSQGEK